MMFENRWFRFGAVLSGLLFLLLRIFSQTTVARADSFTQEHKLYSMMAEAEYQILPAIVTSTPEGDGSIYHEVQPGNTIWKISEDYDINIWQLLEQNDLTYDSFIHPGDTLLVQPPAIQTATPQPTPTQPTPTPTPKIESGSNAQTDSECVPSTTQVPWKSVELKAPFPRMTLMIFFLVIGCGLLILAVITVLTNYHYL